MLRHLSLFIFYVLFSIATVAQEKTRSINTYFKVEKKYLVLPVKNGATHRNLELWVDGINTRSWNMELAEDTVDWYAYMEIDEWKGKDVELRVDKVSSDSKIFSSIQQSDADTNANMYRESMRPQFHFSPKRGWTNDPNGLVYFNGEYHLFYQHNPYGRQWGNMTWGHVVSRDLVHWEEIGDVLHPNQAGPVFSGGAVIDSHNTSGLAKDREPVMVLFHTGARSWGQYLSWSRDGRRFETLPQAIVPRINKDNRDPKVIWHAPTQKWVMVLWVERGDNVQHSMQFLTSPDLLNWTKTSTVMGGIGNDRYLHECPEFYELPVEGTGQRKWVLSGANAAYAIGSFDGITFTPEAEKLQGYHGRGFYAAQTFSDVPDGRRIEIGWWQTNTAIGSMPFNQSMSIPMEHKLVQTAEGPRLTRMPVKELQSLREKQHSFKTFAIREGTPNPLKDISAELLEIRAEILPGKAESFNMIIRGVELRYSAKENSLIVDGVKAPVQLVNGKLKLIVYADRTGLEIFANDGLVFMPININIDNANRSIAISAKGGKVRISKLDVYELKSIW